ncbi:hypothetical protein S40288_01798 [Stachybotrys chartarum IBT 40288]|nr:hypothetical protein S40288_01798 [Stachybotrys chartarum IBT 40288]
MAGVKRSLSAMLGPEARRIDDLRPLKFLPFDSTSAATTRSSSPTCPAAEPLPNFRPDASLVLVGIRGSGKSTLAIMASAAMKRSVVDMEVVFQRDMGMSSWAYRKLHGATTCCREQLRILQKTLGQNGKNSIIVCSWMDQQVQQVLREFCETNPVVHVIRDADAIREHLKMEDMGRVRDLLDLSNAMFRTCTNYEFFNVSETPARVPGTSTPTAQQAAPYLTLKQAERHLKKFLSLIYPPSAIPLIESVFPLAAVPLEDRYFTYALELPLSRIVRGEVDMEEMMTGVDAIQVTVSPETLKSHDNTVVATYLGLASDMTHAIGIVRRSAVVPIILHVELSSSTEEHHGRLYMDLVSHALRLAPEMVTVDLHLDESHLRSICRARRRSRIIGTYTSNISWDSDLWVSMYRKACLVGCDMVRLLRHAIHVEDHLDASRFRGAVAALTGPSLPLTAYNISANGRHSACFNPILTLVAPENSQIPRLPTSCLTAVEATKALVSSFVYDPMKLYVFGVNVSYSASPAMHNAALQACGIPHQYNPHSVDTLSGIRQLIEDPHFGGASFGQPYKVEVISLTHSLSRHASCIGSVNTLIPVRHLNPDGSIPQGAAFFNNVNRAGPVKALYGENTDWIGIRACIRRGLSPANAVRSATCGLIVGAGGMARAAVYAMLQVGVRNIAIYNRTHANAEKLVRHFTTLLDNEESQHLGGGRDTCFHIIESLDGPWAANMRSPTIIISCIPTHRIGDEPAPDFEAPDEWLQSPTGGVIVELGYKNLDTPLLRQARARASKGWVVMDGIDLLPEQGFAQFELFTGRRAPRRVMRKSLLEGYKDEQGRSNLMQMKERPHWMYELT